MCISVKVVEMMTLDWLTLTYFMTVKFTYCAYGVGRDVTLCDFCAKID